MIIGEGQSLRQTFSSLTGTIVLETALPNPTQPNPIIPFQKPINARDQYNEPTKGPKIPHNGTVSHHTLTQQSEPGGSLSESWRRVINHDS